MQLENYGSPGSFGSHWEKSIIYNEFMSPEFDGFDYQYTRFSLAFLKDTNWYADINMDQAE